MSVSSNIRTKLSLVFNLERLAVCRLPSKASIPTWAGISPGDDDVPFFCSITRTPQELSIVCPQIWVPTGQEADGDGELNVEGDWIALQVEGPLDFGLTGIMARLTAPLADAGISIFAISTYDTDYLMVKQNKLQQAIHVLEDSNQFVVTATPSPMNGPASTFLPDAELVRPLKEESSTSWPETFGLVLVAGWPPLPSFQNEYDTKIVPLLQQCFEPRDLERATYIYPSTALHCTLATLWSFVANQKEQLLSPQQKEDLSTEATRVVEKALGRWKDDTVANTSLSLELHSMQLGSRAAILLWKDTSGSVRRLRRILQQEISSGADDNNAARLLSKGLSIPDILHTTVVRFAHAPEEAKGAAIQTRFQKAWKGFQKEQQQTIALEWPLDSVSLVSERRPYMHVPNDEEYVLHRHELKGE